MFQKWSRIMERRLSIWPPNYMTDEKSTQAMQWHQQLTVSQMAANTGIPTELNFRIMTENLGISPQNSTTSHGWTKTQLSYHLHRLFATSWSSSELNNINTTGRWRYVCGYKGEKKWQSSQWKSKSPYNWNKYNRANQIWKLCSLLFLNNLVLSIMNLFLEIKKWVMNSVNGT